MIILFALRTRTNTVNTKWYLSHYEIYSKFTIVVKFQGTFLFVKALKFLTRPTLFIFKCRLYKSTANTTTSLLPQWNLPFFLSTCEHEYLLQWLSYRWSMRANTKYYTYPFNKCCFVLVIYHRVGQRMG